MTRRLRGILNAWHFQFDLALVSTAQWLRLGGGVVHPLTRRYTARRKIKHGISFTLVRI
ncbi:DUF3265 domain-containing protein [Vibrio sp. 2-2(9)]|nr:DUF3265 domain-containing protein [Vibrio alginolyticus]NNN40832.1 DUF3265 domain-containing protein [Vibrio sp. 2-2(2)]NNN90704.1 DUF3265 domain-containing protein [Vibrio sp. 2-2(9)]NNO01842.1 DUF3265 domain-containing protein [Vibrio sp. 7-5(1-a)]